MSDDAPATGLLSREHEVACLREAVGAAADGRGSLVIVTGPAGIGKTTLMTAAQHAAAEAGVLARRARGGELERDFPLGVVRQLLERPLAEAAPELRAELLQGAEAAGLALEPGAASAPAGDLSFAVAHALYWLIANLAARRPLALLVDDAHWADPASLRVLAHLAARLEDLPVILVVARRDADPAADVQLLGALEAGATTVLRPAPLDPEASSELLRGALGTAPDRAFTAACQRVTGGNPFLLGELAGTLRADGVVPRGDQISEVEAVAPSTIAHMVLLRLGRLPPAGAVLARAVAVMGADVDLADAATVAGLDPAQAAQAADSLVAAGVFAAGERLEFMHPVLRTVVLDDLGPGERGRLHAAAWRALAADPARTPSELAPHALALPPSGDPDVAAKLMIAVIDALARGAPVEAGRLARRALAEPPPDADRPRLLELAGQAELYTSDGTSAMVHLRETARLTSDPVLRAHCHLTLARMVYPVHGAEAAVAMLDAALTGPLSDLSGEVLAGVRSDHDAMALQHETTAAAADARIPRVAKDRFSACAVAAQALLRADDAERARTAGALVFADSGGLVKGGTQRMAMYQPVTALAMADALDEARRAAASLIDAARGEAMMNALAPALVQIAVVQWRAGELPGAEADARAATQLPAVFPGIVLGAQAWLAIILLARGDLDGAAEAVAATAPIRKSPPAVQLQIAMAAHAELRHAQGDAEAAAAIYRDLLDRQRRARVRTPWPWRLEAIRAFGEAGGPVAEEVDALREDAERWGAGSARALALRAQALTAAEPEAAVAALRAARELLCETPARLDLAAVTVELGSALRRGGERSEAHDLLREGIDRARACGATGLVARAHEELVVAGARPRRLQFSGVESLTAAERRVAELAAGGLSNRAIAQRLYVTPKTVENQLGRAYGKLGIASRAELTDAFASA